MSKKSERKLLQTTNSEADTVNEWMDFIDQEHVLDYLRKILSRYAGYNFISISKSIELDAQNTPNIKPGTRVVHIQVHRNLPIQNKEGEYQSDKDSFVRNMFIQSDFEGMIMDRNKSYAFGNPFKPASKVADEKLPDIGESKEQYTVEDETVEPL